MSTTSSIEWTDTTWNPVVGCKMVSPGCANCYAETMANRLAAMARKDQRDGKNPGRKAHYLNVINDKGRWAGNVVTVPEALRDPLGWRKPRRVFVNSMSDLFHEDVPFPFIDKVFAVMAMTPRHTYQVLTKRPERMAEYLSADRQREVIAAHTASPLKWRQLQVGWPLPNVWLGTSVENQAAADERIPHLLRCPAAVRFLSCEPLLGPVEIPTEFLHGEYAPADFGGAMAEQDGPSIDWIIVGGESGHGARPCNINWIRQIVIQCADAGVACFVKQLGAVPYHSECVTPEGVMGAKLIIRDGKGGDMLDWPVDLQGVREFPGTLAEQA